MYKKDYSVDAQKTNPEKKTHYSFSFTVDMFMFLCINAPNLYYGAIMCQA